MQFCAYVDLDFRSDFSDEIEGGVDNAISYLDVLGQRNRPELGLESMI